MPDVDAEDALQVAQRALQKVNEQEDRIDDLEAALEEERERLTGALLRLSEEDNERKYRNYSRDAKIGMVREHAFERATETANGKAKLYYDDVEWGVFDGEPSPDHCYKLMELAAQADGFEWIPNGEDNKHLRVDAEMAKRSLAFSSANKTTSSGGGR